MPRIYLEHRDMGDDLRRLVDLIEADAHGALPPGEFAAPIDVLETPDTIEVIADVPGIPRDQIHLVFARGTLLLAGMKRPSVCRHSDAAFHLVERTFGRFARTVRLAGAVDVGRARATLIAGELRIVIPRIAERRGGEIPIAIETD
jgi:HSP20 family protein